MAGSMLRQSVSQESEPRDGRQGLPRLRRRHRKRNGDSLRRRFPRRSVPLIPAHRRAAAEDILFGGLATQAESHRDHEVRLVRQIRFIQKLPRRSGVPCQKPLELHHQPRIPLQEFQHLLGCGSHAVEIVRGEICSRPQAAAHRLLRALVSCFLSSTRFASRSRPLRRGAAQNGQLKTQTKQGPA